MARKSTAPSPPEEEIYTGDQELLPPSAAPETSSANEINLRAQRAEEQLLDLKRQQEEIERQKRELDELSRKRREFDEGRREIVERLTRGLVLLEREEFEVKRELEQIKSVRNNFQDHLGQTEGLNPNEWSAEDLPSELTKALAHVDQAKAIYSQSRARLAALRQSEEGAPTDDIMPELAPLSTGIAAERSFGSMVRDGLAYSVAPVILLTIFTLIVCFLLRAH